MKDEVEECMECKSTYFSKDNACEDCEIENCKNCEEREADNGELYTECVVCYDSYDIVKEFYIASNSTRDVCGWTRKIENCAKVDQDNRLNCQQCTAGFYFDSTETKCVQCGESIENCLTCNLEGTECSLCDTNFNVRTSDKQCW